MAMPDVQKLQRLAFGCLGAAATVYFFRRQGQLYLGQGRVSVDPYLLIQNGELVSVQHTFSSSAGIRVLLIPMLPVAQKTFYDDVLSSVSAENGLVLREGVKAEGVPVGAAAGPASPDSKDGSANGDFDKEFGNSAQKLEWKDYDDGASSSARGSAGGDGLSATGGTVAHQAYFDDLAATTCPTELADLSAEESRWQLSKVFQFPPLSPERRDRLLQVLEQQSQVMQYGAYDPASRGGGRFDARLGSPPYLPDSIALPWNAGSCPAIAEALAAQGYTLVSRTNRVILDRSNFRKLYRLRGLSDASGVNLVLSKLVRI